MKAIRQVSPGQNGHVTNEYGIQEKPPPGWSFLPAGDSAVTRKVTDQGTYWRVAVKQGRRTLSKGVWAPNEHILAAKKAVIAQRNDPAYAKKQAQARARRDKKQAEYAQAFEQAVAHHLGFHEKHKPLETAMAKLVAAHATPVGSGTVARTTTIPIPVRAAKAVTAWMRHQTTSYDDMKIARVKGRRRAVRRALAAQSGALLDAYRSGEPIPDDCPLYRALGEG